MWSTTNKRCQLLGPLIRFVALGEIEAPSSKLRMLRIWASRPKWSLPANQKLYVNRRLLMPEDHQEFSELERFEFGEDRIKIKGEAEIPSNFFFLYQLGSIGEGQRYGQSHS